MSDEWHIYQAEGDVDLDLDELEATAEAYGDGVDHAAEFFDAFDDQTVKALIARVRRAEREVLRQYDGAEPGTLLGTFAQLAVELNERRR